MKKRTIVVIAAIVAAVLAAGAILFVVLRDKDSGDGGLQAHTYDVNGTEDPDGEKEPLILEGDTYVITEDNYVNGVNEIYGNAETYIGKKIQFEGEYMADMYENEMFYQVYRSVIEHCHEDHDHSSHSNTATRVGFRIKYDGMKPNDKDFVRVVGVVDTYEYNGSKYIIINAETLEKCETAGKVEIEN